MPGSHAPRPVKNPNSYRTGRPADLDNPMGVEIREQRVIDRMYLEDGLGDVPNLYEPTCIFVSGRVDVEWTPALKRLWNQAQPLLLQLGLTPQETEVGKRRRVYASHQVPLVRAQDFIIRYPGITFNDWVSKVFSPPAGATTDIILMAHRKRAQAALVRLTSAEYNWVRKFYNARNELCLWPLHAFIGDPPPFPTEFR